ncbi:MAG: TIGR02444 family protein [Sneathiella sp.]
MTVLPSELSGKELWDFAVWIYGGEGVKEACLSLQKSRDIDVPLFLSCIWASRVNSAGFTSEVLTDVLEISIKWQRNVVKPLRSVRDYLKNIPDASPATMAMRQSVLADELKAEQFEITELQGAVSGGISLELDEALQIRIASDNIGQYLASLPPSVPFTEKELKNVRWILCAAFPEDAELPEWLSSVSTFTLRIGS